MDLPNLKATASATVSGSDNQTSVDNHHEVKTTSWWRKIVGLVWDSAEGEPRERKYVQKIDAYML